MTLYQYARIIRCARCSQYSCWFGAPPKLPSWIYPESLLPPWLAKPIPPLTELPKAVIPDIGPQGHANPKPLNVKFAVLNGLFLCPECRDKYPRPPRKEFT